MDVLYFSINQALDYAGGYWHIFKKLQNKFIKEYANFPDVLKEKEQAGDYDQIRLLIHSLKGVTKNLGANRLYEVSITTEEKLKNGTLNPLAEYLTVFANTYQEIKSFSNT